MPTRILFEVCATGVLGVVLLLFNVPTLIALLGSRLRVRYAVLAALLIACALNGVQCLGHVVTTIVELGESPSANRSENALSCMSNPTNLLDQFTFTAVPVMLMMVSIDRWLVVAYPLQYCYNIGKYVAGQIVFAYAFIFFVQAFSILWTGLSNRSLPVGTCSKTNYMPSELYTLLVIIRVTAAALSIVFMLIVLIKLKLRIENISQYRTNTQLRVFMRRQRSFTNAMLISCGFTLVLFVVPTCVSLYGRFVHPDSVMISKYSRFVTFFNSLNMVVVIVMRTSEIRGQLARLLQASRPICTDNSSR